MELNLKGGVLIIGSLYWQDHLNVEGDDIRKNWRNSRLNINTAIDVSVPIRYGRFSKDEAYTMVFDSSLKKDNYGASKFCSFKNDINNWTDLLKEAILLSVAEGMMGDFIAGELAWSICGILFNEKTDEKIKVEVLTYWENQLKLNSKGATRFVYDPNMYSMDTTGHFTFNWPEELNDYDFLIATATRPKKRKEIAELTVGEIATHVPNRHYFLPNRKHGIVTYQDSEILKRL